MEEFVDPLFFARYAAYVRQYGTGDGLPADWVDELEEQWKALATLFQPSIENVSCEMADFPGYLKLSAGGAVILAPVFLAVSVPVDGFLDLIMTFGSAVRIDCTSVLCLSGSAVFGRALKAISDFDYCEYVQNPADVGARVDSKATSTQPAFFVEGRVDERRFGRLDVKNHGVTFAGMAVQESVKLNYVGKTATGPRPVSNLSLVAQAAYRRTWPFQEVVIASGTIERVPQSLINAQRLGEYLLWLDEQIVQFLPSKPTREGLSKSE